MTQPQDIALAFPRGGHLELLIEGVLSYVSEKQLNWCYITALESHGMSVLDLVNWPGDGILAAINTEEEAACAKASKVPIVNISSALPHSARYQLHHRQSRHGCPCCRSPNQQGVSLVCLLWSQGRGIFSATTSRLRGETQVPSISNLKNFCHLPLIFTRASDWMTQNHELAKWLEKLPKPLGLFAVSDYRARQVLDACRNSGLRVPEEVAIVGTGNEDLVCGHVRPTLTSVARNNFLQGYRSAELLDNLMRGLAVPGELLPIPPLEIVERDSTRTFAVSDPRLRDALEYLHEHLHEPLFSIDDITRQASVSRRWLEYAFRDALGETPYQYLRRQRLARAKRLLVEEPKTKIYKIAQSSGFSSAKQLAMTFQQDFGMSPREYRRVSKS